MKKISAEFKLIDTDGVSKPIGVFIEVPQQETENEYSCSLKIEPKMPSPQQIYGVDEQQAFTLAVGVCETFLSSLIAKGGELFYADGKKYAGSIQL